MDFPFESYKQVFIEPEMAVSSLSLGASVSIFSSQVLFDEKVIDQVWHSFFSYRLDLFWLNFLPYTRAHARTHSHTHSLTRVSMHMCLMYDGEKDACNFISMNYDVGPLHAKYTVR